MTRSVVPPRLTGVLPPACLEHGCHVDVRWDPQGMVGVTHVGPGVLTEQVFPKGDVPGEMWATVLDWLAAQHDAQEAG